MYKTQIHCSLPVIRATFCLIFGIFVGFQKSHRFISYFNLLHTAAWGPDGDCSFCCRLLLDLFILIAKFSSQLSTRIEEVQLGLVPFSLQLIYSIFSTVLTIVIKWVFFCPCLFYVTVKLFEKHLFHSCICRHRLM